MKLNLDPFLKTLHYKFNREPNEIKLMHTLFSSMRLHVFTFLILQTYSHVRVKEENYGEATVSGL